MSIWTNEPFIILLLLVAQSAFKLEFSKLHIFLSSTTSIEHKLERILIFYYVVLKIKTLKYYFLDICNINGCRVFTKTA